MSGDGNVIWAARVSRVGDSALVSPAGVARHRECFCKVFAEPLRFFDFTTVDIFVVRCRRLRLLVVAHRDRCRFENLARVVVRRRGLHVFHVRDERGPTVHVGLQ